MAANWAGKCTGRVAAQPDGRLYALGEGHGEGGGVTPMSSVNWGL